MKLVPVNGRVLVRPQVQNKSKGGILLPDTAQTSNNYGEVLAISCAWEEEGKQREAPSWLHVGAVVQFSSHYGTEITDDEGNKLVLVNINSITALRVN